MIFLSCLWPDAATATVCHRGDRSTSCRLLGSSRKSRARHASQKPRRATWFFPSLKVGIQSRRRMRLRPDDVRIGPGHSLSLAMLDHNPHRVIPGLRGVVGSGENSLTSNLALNDSAGHGKGPRDGKVGRPCHNVELTPGHSNSPTPMFSYSCSSILFLIIILLVIVLAIWNADRLVRWPRAVAKKRLGPRGVRVG